MMVSSAKHLTNLTLRNDGDCDVPHCHMNFFLGASETCSRAQGEVKEKIFFFFFFFFFFYQMVYAIE